MTVISYLTLFILHFILMFTPGIYIADKLVKAKRLKVSYAVMVSGAIYGLLGLGFFGVYLYSNKLGLFLSYVLFALTAYFIFSLYLNRQQSVLKHPHAYLPLLMVFSVGIFYTSTVFSCTRSTEPTLNKYCHTYNITFDNILPQIFANNTYNSNGKALMGSWQGSDRPPLQTGIVLAQTPLTLSKKYGDISYEIIAVLQQLLWIPAVWLVCIKLNLNMKRSIFILALCIFSGFFFFNSIFVWPKLLAASMVLLSFCLLLFEDKDAKKDSYLRWIVIGLGFSLGMLSHTSVVFTVVPLLILALSSSRYRPNTKKLLTLAATCILLMAPWFAYQKYYDPPGDRLVKWHIGGSEAIDNRTFLTTLKDSYSATSPKVVLENKISNILMPLGRIPPKDDVMYSHSTLGRVRTMDFKYILFSLGVLNLGWVLLYIKKINRHITTTDKRVNLLLAVVGVSILLWALVLFGPNGTYIHQGSYANIVLLFIGLGYYIGKVSKLLLPVFTLQFLYFFLVWYYSVLKNGGKNIPMLCISIVSLISVMLILKRCFENKRMSNENAADV